MDENPADAIQTGSSGNLVGDPEPLKIFAEEKPSVAQNGNPTVSKARLVKVVVN